MIAPRFEDKGRRVVSVTGYYSGGDSRGVLVDYCRGSAIVKFDEFNVPLPIMLKDLSWEEPQAGDVLEDASQDSGGNTVSMEVKWRGYEIVVRVDKRGIFDATAGLKSPNVGTVRVSHELEDKALSQIKKILSAIHEVKPAAT